MESFIQYKYIIQVGMQLEGFKEIKHNFWNFRCPLCGDSLKNKNKKRGYIYFNDGEYRFHCHNCGINKSFSNFLYNINSELYKEYKKEAAFTSLHKNTEENVSIYTKQSRELPKISEKNNKYLIPLTELNNDHPAISYVRGRRIPESKYGHLFWTDNVDELVRSTLKSSYDDVKKPTSGLVFIIRAIDSANYPIIGYQIRSIDKNIPKNKRFMIFKEHGFTGVFGLEHLDKSRPIFVVEGPIDSLFIPNSIAAFTSSLWRVKLSEAIYVNDCEPRNANIVKQIMQCIKFGYKTVLLPHEYISLDINDMVCQYNLNESELLNILNSNTFSGLTAKMRFTKWRLV